MALSGLRYVCQHRIRSVCCARTASGHAAAPPRSAMKSRRLKAGMRLFPRAAGFPHPQLSTEGLGLVLGSTLNRSESGVLGLPSRASRLIALDELRIVLALDAADLHKYRRLEVGPWSLPPERD